MLQPRMRIFLLYTGCLLEAVHNVSKNPGSHKADFSRNTAIRESGLKAAVRRSMPEGRLWAKSDYLTFGRTIIHVNAMSTSVRHFLSVRHGGCGPMSASFRAENL